MKKWKMSRKDKSILYANIIYWNNLTSEWLAYSECHPKIKSPYRLANLFLLNKKLRWNTPDGLDGELNMSNLKDIYFDDIQRLKDVDDYFNELNNSDADFYEPDDYDGHDIGTATVIELRYQNGEF